MNDRGSCLLIGAGILMLGCGIGYNFGHARVERAYASLVTELNAEIEMHESVDEALKNAQAPRWCEIMQEQWDRD